LYVKKYDLNVDNFNRENVSFLLKIEKATILILSNLNNFKTSINSEWVKERIR